MNPSEDDTTRSAADERRRIREAWAAQAREEEQRRAANDGRRGWWAALAFPGGLFLVYPGALIAHSVQLPSRIAGLELGLKWIALLTPLLLWVGFCVGKLVPLRRRHWSARRKTGTAILLFLVFAALNILVCYLISHACSMMLGGGGGFSPP